MNEYNSIDLSSVVLECDPFPHLNGAAVLQDHLENLLFDWFEHTDAWTLAETDFYEQYEINMLDIVLPNPLSRLVSEAVVNAIREKYMVVFNLHTLELVGLVAHKLITGQKIGIHNDFIDDEETHRLVIHVNPRWSDENGGYLMLFHSGNVTDVAKVIPPAHNTMFGFEISPRSHHAVSKIYDYTRYTLIYTFKKG
jgi:Rps23 Pro-64 3,4-dihydroxylase Tpa1-like proline 4-hydroxylase